MTPRHMTPRRWTASFLTIVLGALGSAVGLGSAVADAAPSSPCGIVTARAIQKVIHEPVQAGAPSQYVPEICDYPLTPTADLERNFTVGVDLASKCPTEPAKGLTAIKVGRFRGFYDVRTRESTPKTEIHSPAVYVRKGNRCVNVAWNLPSGPLPKGSRAATIRRQLVALEALVLRGMTTS
jgi:hypothetical protein